MTKRTEQLIEALEENDALRAMVVGLLHNMAAEIEGVESPEEAAATWLSSQAEIDLALVLLEEDAEANAPLDSEAAA